MTVLAKLVAEGVGPLVAPYACLWECAGDMAGRLSGVMMPDGHVEVWDEDGWVNVGIPEAGDLEIDLSNPAIAFGAVILLDAWEMSADPRWPDRARAWIERLALASRGSDALWDEETEQMAARLTVIGQDAALRRHLWPDVEVEPGTLAVWDFVGGDDYGQWCWQMRYEGRHHGFADGPNWQGADTQVTPGTLNGKCEPGDARATVYSEVCS